MGQLTQHLRGAAVRFAGAGSVNRALRRVAAARRRDLVLVYHRVVAHPRAPHEPVPSVAQGMFRRQLEALGEAGKIVALPELLRDANDGSGVRFAITFDDDDANHVEHALPVLASMGCPATFFLSGRCLHNLGGYWWESLEAYVREHGLAAARSLTGAPADSVEELARALQDRPEAQARLSAAAPRPTAPLRRDELRALSNAGMTVGFHTVEHQVLTRMDAPSLATALTAGRAELAEVVGQPLDLFAYPHGEADARTAAGARRAGYTAAFTGRDVAVAPGGDRYRIGRWEAGPLEPEALLAKAVRRLLGGDR